MDANYDKVEDVILALNDAGVQGQGCADRGRYAPNIVKFARKLVIKSAMLQERWPQYFLRPFYFCT